MNRKEIETLLQRNLFLPEYDKNFFENKTIMITGAGGSIGSAIAQELSKLKPQKLILFEIDEIELFNIAEKLSGNYVIPVVGDITDPLRIKEVFLEHKIDIIIHAAAYKHLPMMEENPTEAVRVNIFGTYNMAKLSVENGVEQFLLISTDKAVEPTSIMGRSKKIAELICGYLDRKKTTTFIILRFGNVLGSRGSVLEKFSEKIERGEPLPITHPEMKRFFVAKEEVVSTSLFLLSRRERGTFILNVDKPLHITELAKRMVELYSPTQKIKIVYTSPFPGEKLEEKLYSSEETPIPTNNSHIWKLKTNFQPDIEEKLETIQEILLKEMPLSEKKIKLREVITRIT